GRRGELPLVRTGKRHVRVRPAALREWIAQREDARSGLTGGLYATYSKLHERRRVEANPKTARADTGSVGRARRRRSELDSTPGAGRNRHPRNARALGTPPGGDGAGGES